VDFEEQPVDAHRYRRPRQHLDELRLAPGGLARRARLRRAVEEVLVLANQDKMVFGGIAPDLRIGS
jgi:hypothetical protein